MMAHAALGADILAQPGSPQLASLVPLVRHHHEWYLGGGYPDGLVGDEIPMGAAILSVADAFDTMTTDRPYRRAMPVADAVAEIGRCAGTQFHPRVAEAMQKIVESREIATAAVVAGDRVETMAGRITPVDVRPVSVLHRIAGEISCISGLGAFLEAVVTIVADELHYTNASTLLPSSDGTEMVVHADIWPNEASQVGNSIPMAESVTGRVFQHRELANIGDIADDAAFVSSGFLATRSEITVPLIVDNDVLGVINVESDVPNAFTALDERLLTLIAAHVAPALQLARLHDEVKRAAQRDGLTGLYNHAAFYSYLEEHLATGEPVAVIIFDVEGLKRVNDTAGHLAGDNVLRRVAMTLELETRHQDLVARYGGDEFAVIAAGVDEPAARELSHRLQQAVNGLTWGPEAEFLSISVGLALAPVEGDKATELVAKADARMYGARYISRAQRDESNTGGERRAAQNHDIAR